MDEGRKCAFLTKNWPYEVASYIENGER